MSNGQNDDSITFFIEDNAPVADPEP